MTDYSDEQIEALVTRLRRYPAIRDKAWELYEKGFCYDDEMDNGPIEKLAVDAANALAWLQRRNAELERDNYLLLKDERDGLRDRSGPGS